MGRRLVAVYDRKTRAHRWVLDSTGCAATGKITWLGGRGDLLLGTTYPVHPVFGERYGMSLFVIDLTRGSVHFYLFKAEAPVFGVKLSGQELVIDGPKKGRLKMPIKEILAKVKGKQ